MRTFYRCGHINKNKTKDITKPFFRKRMTIPTFLNKASRCKGPKQSTVVSNFYHSCHHRYCYPSAFSDTSTNRQAASFPTNTPSIMNTLESELK